MKMKPLSLKTVAEVTGGKLTGASDENALITCVVTDSRKVTEGALFICIKGERSDGHDYAQTAVASGALACLCEHEVSCDGALITVPDTLEALKKIGKHYRSLFDIPFVGVIGSVGKTTAKEMIACVLSKKYSVLKTPENLNNEIGVPLTLLSLREEHTAAVVEMGISDFGEMSRLADMVRPDVVVMTAIGYCHLENLHDLDGVLRAKSEVFDFVGDDAVAVVCGDDDKLDALELNIKKITYGTKDTCDIRADSIKTAGFGGITAKFYRDTAVYKVSIPAFGSHIVLAALAGAAVGSVLGVSDADVRAGLCDYAPVGGRANFSDTGYITVINDCYNANPNSVTASLNSLKELKCRRVAILGDMNELGERSAELHAAVGALAAQNGIDLVIACGEKARAIAEGFAAVESDGACVYFASKDALIAQLGSFIKKGDSVLVKASHSLHFEEIVSALCELS